MMIKRSGLYIFILLLSWPYPAVASDGVTEPLAVASPDGRLRATFRISEQSRPAFDVTYNDRTVAEGTLGLDFLESGPLGSDLKVVEVRRASRNEVYSIPVGKASSARDHHRELVVSLQEAQPPHRRLDIAFRIFDDGFAFRYLIPEQESLDQFVLTDELTRLSFSTESTARALPLTNYTTPYEAYYEKLPAAEIGPKKLLGVPLLLERTGQDSKPLWIAVTEANLTDYAGMYLSGIEAEPGAFATKLSPLPGREDGAKVIGQAPHASPWRVLMIADDPGRLLESHLIFHLSDPPKIQDPSWIKPGKTTFPWWNHYVLEGVDFEPGVNTATMKHYIDFCAEHGIPYHSLDGLDIAWYGGPIHPKDAPDVTTAAPSIDLPEVLRYAGEKGVRLRLWMHWKALEPQLDEAFATYERWGIEGVMIDFMDRDDQEMVRWYHEVAQKAAEHHLTVTWHGAYKPTGMERTWPNVLTYEAVLNQEYNKWQPPGVKGTPPDHNLDVAFIRMLAGPLDYHQGGMRNVLPENYQFRDIAPPVQGTRGHQLAMYVIYQNHLPMLADFPSAYVNEPEFEFLLEVPSHWDETRVLHAQIDECLVIARRKGDVWYIGGMTAGDEQSLELPLHFLGDGAFMAELYLDDAAADPTTVVRRDQPVSAADSISVSIPRCGGFTARLSPAAQ